MKPWLMRLGVSFVLLGFAACSGSPTKEPVAKPDSKVSPDKPPSPPPLPPPPK